MLLACTGHEMPRVPIGTACAPQAHTTPHSTPPLPPLTNDALDVRDLRVVLERAHVEPGALAQLRHAGAVVVREALGRQNRVGDLGVRDKVDLDDLGLKGCVLGAVALERLKQERRGLPDHVALQEELGDRVGRHRLGAAGGDNHDAMKTTDVEMSGNTSGTVWDWTVQDARHAPYSACTVATCTAATQPPPRHSRLLADLLGKVDGPLWVVLHEHLEEVQVVGGRARLARVGDQLLEVALGRQERHDLA